MIPDLVILENYRLDISQEMHFNLYLSFMPPRLLALSNRKIVFGSKINFPLKCMKYTEKSSDKLKL